MPNISILVSFKVRSFSILSLWGFSSLYSLSEVCSSFRVRRLCWFDSTWCWSFSPSSFLLSYSFNLLILSLCSFLCFPRSSLSQYILPIISYLFSLLPFSQKNSRWVLTSSISRFFTPQEFGQTNEIRSRRLCVASLSTFGLSNELGFPPWLLQVGQFLLSPDFWTHFEQTKLRQLIHCLGAKANSLQVLQINGSTSIGTFGLITSSFGSKLSMFL